MVVVVLNFAAPSDGKRPVMSLKRSRLNVKRSARNVAGVVVTLCMFLSLAFVVTSVARADCSTKTSSSTVYFEPFTEIEKRNRNHLNHNNSHNHHNHHNNRNEQAPVLV